MTTTRAVVSARAARRWEHGHPWIDRSDVDSRPSSAAGVVQVAGPRGRLIGSALWSPASEISLRLLDRDAGVAIDAAWWRAKIHDAAARRSEIATHTNAYRIVHGEADGCPSLICDRYDRWLVVQIMSAGAEACRSGPCRITNTSAKTVKPQ